MSVLAFVTLVPFLDKAFHIDDPLFVWVADQIRREPADYYGFDVHWYVEPEGMAEITQNPPLAGYYLAVVREAFGTGEVAAHLGFLLPALGTLLGIFVLARDLRIPPLPTALLVLVTPAFLVSATTIMADVPLLCLWVWSVIAWRRAVVRGRLRWYLLAGALISAACLTKYFGVALLLLLPAYSWLRGGWSEMRSSWPGILIPLLTIVLYEASAHSLYGHGLLTGAATYAPSVRFSSVGGQLLFAVGYLGAALGGVSLLPALSLGRKPTVVLAGIATLIFLVQILWSRSGHASPYLPVSVAWWILLQVAVWTAAGVGWLLSIFRCILRERDSDTWLLLLWISGTLVFALLVNWTLNVRSLLPAVPALALLVCKELRPARLRAAVRWILIPSLGLALLVAWSDEGLAASAREAAERLGEELEGHPGQVWFQGHWGFHYYAEEQGFEPLPAAGTGVEAGDLVVVPENNTNLFPIPPDLIRPVGLLRLSGHRYVSTQHPGAGAGFYTIQAGPLPFVLGPAPDERYGIFRFLPGTGNEGGHPSRP